MSLGTFAATIFFLLRATRAAPILYCRLVRPIFRSTKHLGSAALGDLCERNALVTNSLMIGSFSASGRQTWCVNEGGSVGASLLWHESPDRKACP